MAATSWNAHEKRVTDDYSSYRRKKQFRDSERSLRFLIVMERNMFMDWKNEQMIENNWTKEREIIHRKNWRDRIRLTFLLINACIFFREGSQIYSSDVAIVQIVGYGCVLLILETPRVFEK